MSDQALEVVNSLTSDLESTGIRYCHWKSNQHLFSAVTGETDIDLLVDKEQSMGCEQALIQNGYKRVISQMWCSYPGMEDWLGFDETSGSMVHIHLHYQLLIGMQYVKEMHLPAEKLVLESAIKNETYDIQTADPNLELLLLAIRVGLKTSFPKLLKGVLGFDIVPENIKNEYEYLMKLVHREKLRSFSSRLLNSSHGEKLGGLIERGEINRPYTVYRIKKITSKGLMQFFRFSWTRSRFIYFVRKFIRLAVRNLDRIGITSQKGKIFPNGGIVIAVTGCDGSGKSTVVNELRKWFSWKNDVESIYMGSGDGDVGIFTKIRKRLFLLSKRVKKNSKTTGRSSKNQNWIRVELNRMIAAFFNLALAKERYKKVLMAYRLKANGKIVLTDRYPQNQFEGINDGPRILRDGVFKFKRSKKHECAIYNKIAEMPPDLVIRLNVPIEVSQARKPEEDAEIVKRKIEITQKIKYKGAKIVDINASHPIEEVLRKTKEAVWENV